MSRRKDRIVKPGSLGGGHPFAGVVVLGDETIVITLGAVAGIGIEGDSDATITILDDDDPPAVSWVDASAGVVEDAGVVTLKVGLDAVSVSFDVGP